ncbi:hypothetical protein QOT17_004765 [Balamuthia mandrillaris]
MLHHIVFTCKMVDNPIIYSFSPSKGYFVQDRNFKCDLERLLPKMIVAQHFQHLMDVVTAAIAKFTSHYIDDLAVISQSVEEHIEHLIRVILTLTAAGLCIC